MATTYDEFTSATTALNALEEVLASLTDADMHRPTPCPDYDVATLLHHVTDTIARLGAAAHIPTADDPHATPSDHLHNVTTQVVDGWPARGTHGDVHFSGRNLPDPLALGILSLELVVHGWDLATALHRPIHITDEHAAFVLDRARHTLTPQSRAVAGFDDPVPVADTAATLDKLIAFTGRNPEHVNA
jgi:uncharacterized protein (TIGR03086 family)